MHQNHVGIAVAVGAVAGMFMFGCVERKERLEISPNGALHILIDYKSNDLNDLYQGDAVPRTTSGWLARQEVIEDDEGKQTHRLIAENLFGPRVKPPENYAQKTDPDADLYLQFPSSLRIETRNDGTYYHFSRTYTARPWAHIATLEERLVKKPLAELEDIEFDRWSREQRLMAVRALATFEVERMIAFARAAFLKVTPDVPQDGWLRVREHMLGCLNHLDYDAMIQLLEPREIQEDEAQRGDAVQAKLKEYEESLQDQLKQAMFLEAGLNGSQFTAFIAEYDRQNKYWEITKDLGDDHFEITVVMPGLVTSSNAESAQGNAAVWTFDGGAMRDRDVELLVTSRVPR